MFGIYKRVKDLESTVKHMQRLEECKKGFHQWDMHSGYLNGTPNSDYLSGKRCNICGEFVELTEVKH